uniref:Uncharacterized protein n=1 Tax=Setaria viridis TaxID=4556 RepID=A0A4U6U3Q5_SETVI|nr:hypothetical protein SEVIR_6G143300v2 [Setaria viridis]
MATYLEDPRAHPELEYYTISATGPIKRKHESLIGKMAVCWLTGKSHDTGPHHAVDALDEQMHISHHEVKVIKHFPDQYLILFSDSRAYHRILHRGVRSRGRVFNFKPWMEQRGAVETMLEYRDRTRTYDLWAWSSNPSKILKKVLLTITDLDRELVASEPHHEPPQAVKGAYDYELHLHLSVVEDLSFLQGRDGGDWPPNRKSRWKFLWNYDATDSLSERRSTALAATGTTTTTTSTAAHGATTATPHGEGRQDAVE